MGRDAPLSVGLPKALRARRFFLGSVQIRTVGGGAWGGRRRVYRLARSSAVRQNTSKYVTLTPSLGRARPLSLCEHVLLLASSVQEVDERFFLLASSVQEVGERFFLLASSMEEVGERLSVFASRVQEVGDRPARLRAVVARSEAIGGLGRSDRNQVGLWEC